jgi:hypothetical protein
MFEILTDEQVAEGERLRWDALSAGSIFSIKDENDRMFITVAKDGDRMAAIELNPENIQRIVDSGCCQRNSYTFDEIKVWALHDPESQNRKRTAYRKLHPVPDWTTINPEIYCQPVQKKTVWQKLTRKLKNLKKRI